MYCMGGKAPDTPFWCRHKWEEEEEEEGTRLRMQKIFCDNFFATFLQKFCFAEIFLAAANLFSDADTSGREADSGYERCRDCTDITLHRHHCHRRSTCSKLSDFLQENRDSLVFPREGFSAPFKKIFAHPCCAPRASCRTGSPPGWRRARLEPTLVGNQVERIGQLRIPRDVQPGHKSQCRIPKYLFWILMFKTQNFRNF